MAEDKKPRNSDGTTFYENLKGLKPKKAPAVHRADTEESAKSKPGYKGTHRARADVVDINKNKDKK